MLLFVHVVATWCSRNVCDLLISVRFNSAEEVTAHSSELKVGASVFLVESRAQPLDATVHIYTGKGSDASNKDDEEPAGTKHSPHFHPSDRVCEYISTVTNAVCAVART